MDHKGNHGLHKHSCTSNVMGDHVDVHTSSRSQAHTTSLVEQRGQAQTGVHDANAPQLPSCTINVPRCSSQ